MKKDPFEIIARHKLVPVIKLDKREDALPLAQALVKGGLPVAEVTFRTQAALEGIEAIAKDNPEICLGAGSVTRVEQIKDAVAAGATFIVSAGFSSKIVGYCVENGIPVLPGVCTPTDIMAALEYGLETLKFFPAEQSGGIAVIKAMAAPFPGLRFVPTGGISIDNVTDYLREPLIVACGGSWMVKDSLIRNGEFGRITDLTRQAVNKITREIG